MCPAGDAHGAPLAVVPGMTILALLDRCIELEFLAADVYDALARRSADVELAALWSALAQDERGHARKLATWRELVAAEPPEHRPQASGFVDGVHAVEHLLRASLAAAPHADEEEAFAIALAIEASEIDAIYTTLLQASPLARFPDLSETVRDETSAHHRRLAEAAARRCRSERNQLRLAFLQAH
jgi:rubrerythrin